jgi:hypothetical protein
MIEKSLNRKPTFYRKRNFRQAVDVFQDETPSESTVDPSWILTIVKKQGKTYLTVNLMFHLVFHFEKGKMFLFDLNSSSMLTRSTLYDSKRAASKNVFRFEYKISLDGVVPKSMQEAQYKNAIGIIFKGFVIFVCLRIGWRLRLSWVCKAPGPCLLGKIEQTSKQNLWSFVLGIA